MNKRQKISACIIGYFLFVIYFSSNEVKNNAQLAQLLPSTVQSGAVNIIDGRPVFVSEFYPEDMNSSGLVVSGGVLTGFTHVNHRQYVVGEFRQDRIETERSARAGVTWIIVSARREFKKLQPSGQRTAVSGINIQ